MHSVEGRTMSRGAARYVALYIYIYIYQCGLKNVSMGLWDRVNLAIGRQREWV